MTTFLSGSILAFSLCIAVFLFKFWTKTRDRFFAIFAVSFLIFALERLALMRVNGLQDEAASYVYLLRLAAFGLIMTAIVDKNRRASRDQSVVDGRKVS